VFLSGLGREKDEAPPDLYGVATGNGGDALSRAPGSRTPGVGARLRADRRDARGVAGTWPRRGRARRRESDPQFPDPAARILIRDGIDPIAGTETPTEGLVDQATEIRDAKQAFAKQMQEATEESSHRRSR